MLNPGNWRQFIKFLGIQSLSQSGNIANCPFCRKGRIAFYDRFETFKWYHSSCCGVSGSLTDLTSKIKQITHAEADVELSKLLPEYAQRTHTEIKRLSKIKLRRDVAEEIWDSSKTCSSLINSASFSQQLIRASLEFTHLNHWHQDNLDNFIRVVQPINIQNYLRKLHHSERRDFEIGKSKDMVFLIRGFSVPNYLSSLLLITYTGKGVYDYRTFYVDTDERDCGFFINPKTAVDNKNIVVTTNINWFMRSCFWHANYTGNSSPIALALDSAEDKTLSIQMLKSRSTILWEPEIKPKTIRAASRLGCFISHFGRDNGSLSMDQLKLLSPYSLFKGLQVKSMTWESALIDFARQRSPQELTELIISSELTPSQIELVRPHLPRELKYHLEEVDIDACPSIQITLPKGLLEQTPNGWVLYQRGIPERITTHSWRISRVFMEDVQKYEIQIYDGTKWQSFIIPSKQFEADPRRHLFDMTADNGMIPFSVIDRHKSNISHYAKILHTPLHEKASTTALGFDIDNQRIQTNKILIQKNPVEMLPVPAASSEMFFAQADGGLPSTAALMKIIKHTPTFNLISALVLQASNYLNGKKPHLVSFGSMLLPFVVKTLENLDTLDSKYWPCDMSQLINPKHPNKLINSLQESRGVWVSLSKKWTYWAAGVRPTYLIGHKPHNALALDKREMQRAFSQVLYYFLKNQQDNSENKDQEQLKLAWRTTATLSGINRVRIPDGLRVVSPCDAMIYWLKKAILSGHVDLRRRNRGFKNAVIYTNKEITFSRERINEFIVSNKFPRWDMSHITQGIINHPHFVRLSMIGSQQTITLKSDVLNIPQLIQQHWSERKSG